MSDDPSWAASILLDGFERVREAVEHAVLGLSPEQLLQRPGPRANHISWLIWHLARVQDDHIAALAHVLAGNEPPASRTGETPPGQLWPDWRPQFGLPYGDWATGYGQSSEEVGAFPATDAETLRGYYEAVHARTAAVVGGLADDDLGRIVDRRWSPPVTAAVRLMSILNDTTQHVGQAAYVRGLVLG
ncbi:hypothetical protein SCMU_29330 [Sinomonas cyclohexanicum]|uniref:DinB-like domain-containing protein n=1 Tax=Sinomonas cyclohexanicum TaxID=322009 RepID=A0ABM7PXT5_SINCY|nr:DUF664 domain-containing protein [Corynebacterium cyclohexanicum]BCT77091.1 hypothetical protein SCMU_29330 [Corynebacterium cyclohexanicum]